MAPKLEKLKTEEVYSRVEHASSHVDVVLDNIDDNAQKLVNPAEKIYTFYATNSATINAAAERLANSTTYELSQRTAEDVLSPVRKVLDGLQVLSKVHPFVEAGFLVLKGVISIELTRRENDRRTIVLILQMGDMMETLLQLNDVHDPHLKTANGETVVGRLDALMPSIKVLIEKCGVTIDAYRKQHVMVKFVKAPMYADKLISLGKALADCKAKIVYALNIHTAVSVDGLQASVTNMQSQMSVILESVVKSKSADELEWDKALGNLGGWDKCRSDPMKRDELFKLFQTKFRVSSNASPTSNQRRKGKRQKGLNALQDHALDASMDTLVKENGSSYGLKLKQEMKHLKTALDDWGSTIINKLEAGPHERIKHAVIKCVWEDSKWRSSVKATHFIRDLKDFYVDQAFKAAISSQLPTDSKQGSQLSAEGAAKINDSPTSSELQHNPDFDWCLDYLTIFNLPHIMEAFDDDSSGWIKIQEVNAFTDSIPRTWNLLQWMTYWAAGWQYEISRYRNRIQHILSKMNAAQLEVLPVNNAAVLTYMDDEYMAQMAVFIDAAKEEKRPGPELVRLVESNMSYVEGRWSRLLEPSAYGIDSVDSVAQLSSGHRVESFVFPLLYVLLRHHYRIMRLARRVALSEKEFQSASLSISCVMKAIFLRRKNLEEEFRQRRMDVTEQFHRFASGVFANLAFDGTPRQVHYDPTKNPRTMEEEARLAALPDLTEASLKYDASVLDVTGYRDPWKLQKPEFSILPPLTRFRRAVEMACPSVLQWSWASMRRRHDHREEFFSLALKMEKYLERINGFEDSYKLEGLTEKEDTRFDVIYDELLPGDVSYYYSMVSRDLRERLQHLRITCDGCQMQPLTGVRFKCVQCDKFDYCADCEARPPPVNQSGNQEHEQDHDMIKISWPLPQARIDILECKAKKALEQMRGRLHLMIDRQNASIIPNGDGKTDETDDDPVIDSLSDEESDDESNGLHPDNVSQGSLRQESPPQEQQRGDFNCDAGCGRPNLKFTSVFYACLDCDTDHILCSYCQDTSKEAEGARQAIHVPRHALLKIKNLIRHSHQITKPDEGEAAARLIPLLEQNLVPRLTSLDDRYSRIDTRVADVEIAVAEMKITMAEIRSMLRQLLGLGVLN